MLDPKDPLYKKLNPKIYDLEEIIQQAYEYLDRINQEIAFRQYMELILSGNRQQII